ncbi:sugar transferase [Phaeovulum sp.]|uniref:sugar transferase n=1 Tax=Phaeovulum sp. TaxID=2934796 RepID=UPI0039E439C4
MSPAKRAFDIGFALLLLPLLGPLIVLIALGLALTGGGPIFYVSERMKAPGVPFGLWKFRTMRVVAQDFGVSGGDKQSRVTRIGRVLRRFRADELPQLLNILRGDMSFVGPRPPLRQYVEQFPEVYSVILKNRPGVTGLASLLYHRHEERILSACKTSAQTEATYVNRCIPVKSRLDLIYQCNQTIWFDIMLIFQTVGRVLR